ncbi:hypothetical protein CR513_01180, partial [Mucuna pruriens]
MKHSIKDHSIFNIDIIDELVEEHMQIGTGSADFTDFVEILDVISCLNSVEDISDSDLLDSEDNIVDLAYMVQWRPGVSPMCKPSQCRQQQAR